MTNDILQDLLEYKAYMASPAAHFTVDIGINRFKKKLKGLPKSARTKAIKEYKEKVWGRFHKHMEHETTFPTHKNIYCGDTMSQNSLRVAEEATKDKELLGSTNQDDADRQVDALKEQLNEVERHEDELAERAAEEKKGKRQTKKEDK